jgi:hypothetical protein
MRVYSKNSIINFLTTAGFIDINFYEITNDMKKYGIYWSNDNIICNWSLLISAKKS